LGNGLAAAPALAAAPFIPAKDNILTGVVLLAFALGWALLAVLSVRFSTQPQHWAAAPAVFFAVAGLVSLRGSDAVRDVFGWVWPPALLALIVWMIIRPDDSCAAEVHGGCCTRYWAFSKWPP
jgi:hypothetical protein